MSVVGTALIVMVFILESNSSKAFGSGHKFVGRFYLFLYEEFSP